MPAKTGKQYRLAAMIAHGNKPGIGGMSKEVAREMVKKTPKKKRTMFSRGKD